MITTPQEVEDYFYRLKITEIQLKLEDTIKLIKELKNDSTRGSNW